MDNAYCIVFTGRLLDGFKRETVKQQLATKLRLSPQTVDALFSGEKQILKRADSQKMAQQFVEMFARAGLATTVETVAPTAARSVPSPAVATAPRALNPVTPVAPAPLRPWKMAWLYRPALFLVAVFELGTVLSWLALTLSLLVVLLHPALLAAWLSALIPVAPVANMLHALLLAGGGLVVALLLKPLLALRQPAHPTVALTAEHEPDLYAFVEDVCERIAVPPPTRITLSNDAALEVRLAEDIGQGLVKGQTVLVLGLPLLASLNVRQFAAAVAQAMHGWGPREAPRAVWLIEHIVDWMRRAACEEDLIDRQLAQWRERHPGRLADVAQRMIGWSRLPLRMNLRNSRRLAGPLFQRRITQADAAARRLAGNADFRHMLEQSRALAFAAQKIIPSLTRKWHEHGQLPDDIAMAVVAQASYFPDTVHAQLRERQAQDMARTLALPPTDTQRLAWLEQQRETGTYGCTSPSAQLLRCMDKLTHHITLRYYHQHLHLPVTANKLIRTPPKGSQEHSANQIITGCFEGLYADFAPLGLDASFRKLPPDIQTALQHRSEALTLVHKERGRARTVLATLQQGDAELIELGTREMQHRAGLGARPGGLALLRKPNEEIYEAYRECEANYETALAAAGKVMAPHVSRLAATLGLLAIPQAHARIANGPRLHAEVEMLVMNIGARIEQVYPQLRSLRLHTLLLESLLSQDGPRAKRKLRDLIDEKTNDVNRTLTGLNVSLRKVPFPFPAEQKHPDLMHWVLRNARPEGGPAAALDRGSDTVQNLALLQRLIVGRLCAITLQVERALDLKVPPA